MKTDIADQVMTISHVERLTVDNAAGFESTVFENADDSKRIVFDAKDLAYISSAGLRALLKIKKKYDLTVINASQEIYDIFETTGFHEMIPIKKKRKQIHVDGCEVIGTGGTGTIYRIDRETVAKVFNSNFDLAAVEREHDTTRNALVSGIPSMIPFDIAECDGKYAIVYELLSGRNYVDAIKDNPEKKSDYLCDYAGFLRKMNQTAISPDKFKSHKQTYLDLLFRAKEKLSEEEYRLYRDLFEAIPDEYGFIHGDCHLKNIIFVKM